VRQQGSRHGSASRSVLTRLALFATDGLALTYAVDVNIGIDHSLRNVPIDTTRTAEKIFQLYFSSNNCHFEHSEKSIMLIRKDSSLCSE
jgi:hypothetical protein